MLQERYPYYLANRPEAPNADLVVTNKYTGEVATLEDVSEFYNKGGDEAGTFTGTRTDTMKKLDLDKEEKAALVKLLESMTGSP